MYYYCLGICKRLLLLSTNKLVLLHIWKCKSLISRKNDSLNLNLSMIINTNRMINNIIMKNN